LDSYEDAAEMVEYVAQALRQTSREATILLYSPSLDPHLEKMTELADRVFCFYEMPKVPARVKVKTDQKMPKAQVTLEAYSCDFGNEKQARSGSGRSAPKQLVLETAKQIMQEVFHARPSDVEEMIQGRLEEKNSPVKCEEGPWPATFCLGD
jgi:hypothetical protein